MAYPFGPPIPYALLLKRLCEDYGCEIRSTKTPYRDPYKDEAVTFRYLYRRTRNAAVRIAFLPDGEPTREMMPTVVRSICARLGIDNVDFGVLSDSSDDDDDDN
jgi:hypothetical protein